MAVKNRNIQFSSLPEIDEIDKDILMSSVFLSYDKLEKIAKGEVLLHLHFKHSRAKGLRKRHSVHAKISLPGKTILAKADDWKLLTAVQTALRILERESLNYLKRKG
ncbi:MAG: hypothetical protein JW772_02715 [Candidatus Diapherotrites archaeon]|nr:hypothetical protein [Candidatus Diapherotrites archaeon]